LISLKSIKSRFRTKNRTAEFCAGRNMRTAALFLFAVNLVGCATSSVSPSFPSGVQVSKLTVYAGTFSLSFKDITDQSQISEFLAHIGKIKGGWHYAWDTYPVSKARIFFVSISGQVLCTLDIGTNWVGSDCGIESKSKWPPLVSISREESLFLRDFVSGTWEVGP